MDSPFDEEPDFFDDFEEIDMSEIPPELRGMPGGLEEAGLALETEYSDLADDLVLQPGELADLSRENIIKMMKVC